MKKSIPCCVLLYILIIIFILPVSGCDSGQAALTPTNALTVYLPPDTQGNMRRVLVDAIGAFRNQYPDVKVEVKDFDDPQNPMDAYKTYWETLKTELAAGKGPDLIYCINGDFDDLDKTIKSNVFFNLNKTIRSDKTFTLNNYFPSLIDVFRRGDDLPLLPIEYIAPYLVTSKEALEKTGFTLTEGISFDAFMEALSQYYSKANARQPSDNFSLSYLFNYFLENSGISILNQNNKTVTLDSKQFRKLATTYKSIYERVQKVPEADQTAGAVSAEFFINGGALFTSGISSNDILRRSLEIAMAGQTPILFPIPCVNDASSKGMLKPWSMAGIPQSSPNKLNAYNLLKILLEITQDSKINSSLLNTMRLDRLPAVLNELYYKELDILHIQGKGLTADADQIDAVKKNIVNQLQILLTNAPATLGIPSEARSILWNEMEPYFKGSCSLDEAIASAKEKLQLYMDE